MASTGLTVDVTVTVATAIADELEAQAARCATGPPEYSATVLVRKFREIAAALRALPAADPQALVGREADRMTQTYAILPVSKPCFDEILHKLREAGYTDQIHEDDGVVIDMHGIALQAEEDTP